MSDVFVRLHRTAYDGGLMRQLSNTSWKLLCALAVHIDDKYECYPTQATLAKQLGVSERAMRRWVDDLLSVKVNGKPIVTVKKRQSPNKPEHCYNVYTIHPGSCFTIF